MIFLLSPRNVVSFISLRRGTLQSGHVFRQEKCLTVVFCFNKGSVYNSFFATKEPRHVALFSPRCLESLLCIYKDCWKADVVFLHQMNFVRLFSLHKLIHGVFVFPQIHKDGQYFLKKTFWAFVSTEKTLQGCLLSTKEPYKILGGENELKKK